MTSDKARGWISSVAELVDRWGVRGITSNPAIFETAFAHSDDYDEQIADLASDGFSAAEIYESLVLDDRLSRIGVDLAAVTDRLLDEGIRKFSEPFNALHKALEGIFVPAQEQPPAGVMRVVGARPATGKGVPPSRKPTLM